MWRINLWWTCLCLAKRARPVIFTDISWLVSPARDHGEPFILDNRLGRCSRASPSTTSHWLFWVAYEWKRLTKSLTSECLQFKSDSLPSHLVLGILIARDQPVVKFQRVNKSRIHLLVAGTWLLHQSIATIGHLRSSLFHLTNVNCHHFARVKYSRSQFAYIACQYKSTEITFMQVHACLAWLLHVYMYCFACLNYSRTHQHIFKAYFLALMYML